MGEDQKGKRLKRIVFVTVGTTSFDALVRAMDTQAVREELRRRGEDGLVAVDYFTFSPTIADYLLSAELVISHADLRLGKPLVVVVNEDLMDNHQSELADELAARKHLFCSRPQSLGQALRTMDLEALVPYSPGDARPVATHINKFLGFQAD
ncbi:unnamed protein product [Spirodela intermedia]|uniref:Glycosyl transferase family 28 C-terminal domain-containing protein n=1 Tax=Spirodela intermedia TaxID=51605 RepID=A0A7I8J1V6_SPIIN|nr:unnamed protein product [Spirodela intermedia]CAA6664138.1 unnamed protein product [Spirodela intermedia]